MDKIEFSFKKENLYVNIFKVIILLWILSIPFKNVVYQVSTVLIILYFIIDLTKSRDFAILKSNLMKVKNLSIGFALIIISMIISNIMNTEYLTKYSWSEMYKFILRFGVIFVALAYFYNKRYFTKEFIVRLLVISFTIVMITGLYQVWQNFDVVLQGSGIMGTLNNRNAFGLMMGMSVSLSYILISKNKIYIIPLLLLFMFSMIFSFSRSSWVASTASFMLLVFINYKKIKPIHILYFFLIIGFILALYFNIDSFNNRFQQLTNGESSGRITIWLHTISLIQDKLIIGYGLESWKNVPDSFLIEFSDPHNFILEILIYTGLIGLISAFFTIFTIIKYIITSKQYYLLSIAAYFLIVTQFDFGAYSSKELLSFLTIFVFYTYSDIFKD